VIFILVNYLNKSTFFPYFVISTLNYSFGNTCEQIDIANRIAFKNKKKLILIKFYLLQNLLGYNVSNHHLFDNLVFYKKLNKIEIFFFKVLEFILNIEFVFIRSLIRILKIIFKINFPDNINFIHLGISRELYNNKAFFRTNYNLIKSYPKINPKISLKKDIKKICKLLLSEKINYKKKFICLHVRDHFFHNDKKRRNFRNANINNYIKSIDFLIKKGFVVVRLGNSKSKKIKYKNKNFFQYNYSEINSPLLDIYLVENCYFYVGTSSGPIDLAFAMNKPTLITNSVNIFSGSARNKMGRTLMKDIYYKNKKINIQKFIKLDYSNHDPSLLHNKLNFKENSPNQLLKSVKKFYKIVKLKKFKYNKKDIILSNLINISLKHKFYKDDVFKQSNHAIRIIKWIKTNTGVLIF